jgi:hypothetical protein
MYIAKSILLILSGATVGIAFVISCGDNWHLVADAAVDAPKASNAAPVCDCPAAQPLLAGRLVEQSVFWSIDGNRQGSSNLYCPPDTLPISGSCTVAEPSPDKDVILRESGFIESGFIVNQPAWRCSYRNNEPTAILYKIAVSCLRPPQ